MDPYKETFDTWNRVAFLYEEKFMALDLYNATYEHICNTVTKPGARLLEIGCGPGNITKYLLSQRPDFDILGLDIAPNMVELAKKNNPAARFTVMDCREIYTLSGPYDAIICGFCLPYLSAEETSALISGSHDLLNHRGMIYLSFVEGDPEKSGFRHGSEGRVYFYYHPLDEITAQLGKASFGEIRTFHVKYKTSENDFDIHTILIATKQST